MTYEERVDLYRRAGFTDPEIYQQFGIDLRDRQPARLPTLQEWMEQARAAEAETKARRRK